MLNAERKNELLRIVNTDGSASVQELMLVLASSESTIRRDITELHKKGLLKRVHGGAVAINNTFLTEDVTVATRQDLNATAKDIIGKYAARFITDDDVIFLDAGTTTGFMIDYIEAKKAIFFTNSISHARRLSAKDFKVYIPGGRIKEKTEAIIGSDTCAYLSKINFSKGFFGSNGITQAQGFTTPDRVEAAVKEIAFLQSQERFVLADSSKFDCISTSTFGAYDKATIITDDNLPEGYKESKNIILV